MSSSDAPNGSPPPHPCSKAITGFAFLEGRECAFDDQGLGPLHVDLDEVGQPVVGHVVIEAFGGDGDPLGGHLAGVGVLLQPAVGRRVPDVHEAAHALLVRECPLSDVHLGELEHQAGAQVGQRLIGDVVAGRRQTPELGHEQAPVRPDIQTVRIGPEEEAQEDLEMPVVELVAAVDGVGPASGQQPDQPVPSPGQPRRIPNDWAIFPSSSRMWSASHRSGGVASPRRPLGAGVGWARSVQARGIRPIPWSWRPDRPIAMVSAVKNWTKMIVAASTVALLAGGCSSSRRSPSPR